MEEIKIQKLDGDNYNAWKIRARAVLVQKNCWEAIDPGYGAELKPEEKKINEKALTFLFLVVEDQFLDDIADCERAKEAWDILKDIHTKFGLLHSLQLLKEFFNVTLKPGESVSSYLSRLMDLHRKVSSCGHGLADREVALVMLMGLPKEYEGLILNLEREEDTLSTQTVKSRLIVEEKKLLRYTEVKSEVATSEVMGEKALKTRDKYGTKTMQPLQRQHKNTDRKIRCFSCGEWGHIAKNCSAAKTPHAKMVSNDVYQALFVDSCGGKPVCDWYLDSGATEHMCSQEQKFMNLTSVKSQVEIANSEKIEVSGTGNIVLNPVRECGKDAIHLANVLYVPKLDGNLLSVGRIEEMGMTVSFERGKATIKDPRQQNKVILIAHRHGRLYKIEEKQAHKIYLSRHEEIMHRRLGHFHHDAVKKLIKRNDSDMTCEETQEKETVCSTCILGKMKKTPFPK
jgi:hypothetical protein